MGTNTGTIMTIANSIIGVSVLAMPFCFKECGIVLSILMLILSSILSRLTCYLLLKAAVMARRRNFEFLAFHIFGPTGKFVAELCIIGFLVGTCIAFFVVVGDLGPAIISTTIGVDNSTTLRTVVLIGLAVVVVLPLGLLRNVDSLSSVCTATIGFYLCLVLKVVGEALPHLATGDWMERVHLWRPAGMLQCLPIFSMAMFCQTQLFEIYDSLPNPSLERMNGAVRAAINLCTCVYIAVGFFGYVAFCTESFGGNILMSFKPTLMSDVIKLGFVLSVAVSFPLVIFPCRASLYSLLFRRAGIPHHETIKTFIPETKFKCITVFIIIVPLAIGLVIPNIELVLGLVGSTIGVGICVIFPAMAFIFVSTKDTADRVIAQFLLFCGVLILVLGTYATLYAANEGPKTAATVGDVPSFNLPVVENVADNVDLKLPPGSEKVADGRNVVPVNVVSELSKPVKEKEEARQEPPQPVEPAAAKKPDTPALPVVMVEEVPPPDKPKEKDSSVVGSPKDASVGGEEKAKVEEVIDKDALKKEDEELADAEKQAVAASDQKHEEVLRKIEKQAVAASEQKHEEVLRKIEKQDEERNRLIQEQNEILKNILKEKIIANDKKKEESPVLSNKEPLEILPIKKTGDVVKVSDEQQKLIRENEIIKEVLLQEQKKIIKEEKQGAKVESPVPVNNVPVNNAYQVNPLGNEVEKNPDNIPKNENVIPKLPELAPELIQSAIVEDSKRLNKIGLANAGNQPIAYQQRFVSIEDKINPNIEQSLVKPVESLNENKPISIKSLIMDGQNAVIKNPMHNSIKLDIAHPPLVQENVALPAIQNIIFPKVSNELGKTNHVDALQKAVVAGAADEAKVMRREILETDETKPGLDREKRDTLSEEAGDGGNVKSGDITILGEVNEMRRESNDSDAKKCDANDKATVEKEVVPLTGEKEVVPSTGEKEVVPSTGEKEVVPSIEEKEVVPSTGVRDHEMTVDESLIKVGSHLEQPLVEMSQDSEIPEAGSQTNSLLNGAIPMKRDLKSVDSQQVQYHKISEPESKGEEM